MVVVEWRADKILKRGQEEHRVFETYSAFCSGRRRTVVEDGAWETTGKGQEGVKSGSFKALGELIYIDLVA